MILGDGRTAARSPQVDGSRHVTMAATAVGIVCFKLGIDIVT